VFYKRGFVALKFLRNNCAGVSMLELAITIPLIVLPITVALVDLGMNMQKERKANEIVTRVAKNLSGQTINSNGKCGNSNKELVCTKKPKKDPKKPKEEKEATRNDSLQTIGEENLCDQINESEFEVDDWLPKVEIIQEDQFPLVMIPQESKGYRASSGNPEQLAKVTMESKKPFCILCLGTPAKIKTSSVYALQSRCIYE
jgi:hypothetical protein